MTRISRPYILMWTIVGLVLTIGANFLPAYIVSSPLQWFSGGISAYPLGSKCQVGAVLLVSCLGGRTSGVLAQIAYIAIGLTFFKIFNDGGGLNYIYKPNFGYLLAFIPGAWICGQIAFKQSSFGSTKGSSPQIPLLQLENLALSCLLGLLTIHALGIFYLICFKVIDLQHSGSFKLLDSIASYSLYPFLSQLILACAATLISFVLRRIMFY